MRGRGGGDKEAGGAVRGPTGVRGGHKGAGGHGGDGDRGGGEGLETGRGGYRRVVRAGRGLLRGGGALGGTVPGGGGGPGVSLCSGAGRGHKRGVVVPPPGVSVGLVRACPRTGSLGWVGGPAGPRLLGGSDCGVIHSEVRGGDLWRGESFPSPLWGASLV